MATNLQDLPYGMRYDALTLLCGSLLGQGVAREVYTFAPNASEIVIKVETGTQFQNVREWAVWNEIKDAKKIAAWFAPCIRISHYGGWLMQMRTLPVTLADLRKELPKVPAFFTDLKVANWGRLGKRIVCHDYGTALTTTNGLTTRMRKADWWE